MLQTIRDKTSGLIATVIVGLLIITFAFWGIDFYTNQSGEVIAVSVNETDIGLREYQRVYQSVRRQWQTFLNDSNASPDEEIIKQQTLDSLIERELVNQVTDSLGLRVSVGQVRELINGLQVFHGANGFDRSIYERSVAQLGFTPVMFETKIQEDMTSEQLQSALGESVFLTENEVRLIAGIQNQTRDISYSLISSDEIKENIVLTDEEIEDFYKRNSRDYMEPEKVKIAYLDLSLQNIASGVEVTEDALVSYYEANRENYNIEDQRKIRHITVSTGENATEEEIKVATARAEELIGKLKGGMTFDELSEKHSDDAGPKLEISELGFLTKGIMDPAVDEVMFAMEEGELSAPVLTKNSVDVIKLEKIKGGTRNTFENSREQVEEAYRLSVAENRFYEAIDQLANLSFEHPDTLEIASQELKLPIRESDYFDRSSQTDPLLSDSRIISASFNDDVLNGNNSDVIEVGENRVVVLRLIDHKPEQKKAMEDVRDRIVTRMKYEQASAEVSRKGWEILDRLKTGQDPEQVAEEYQLEWTQATAIKRDNTGTNRSILRTAFKLGRPDDGAAVYGGTQLGSGDYALVIVKAVNDPDASSYTEEELEPIRTQLQKLQAASDWTQLVQYIRNASDVNIFADRL